MTKNSSNQQDNSFKKRLGSSFGDVMDNTTKGFDFSKLGYLPRWLVLLFDLCVCLVSLFLTYFIVHNLSFDFNTTANNFSKLTIVLFINLVFFFVFRTYSGLIRHSSFIDAIKIFISSFATFGTLAMLNYGLFLFSGKKLFLLPELIIYFLISFSSLFLYRVVVKQVFEAYLLEGKKENVPRVLMYGFTPNAISAVAALKSQKPKQFEVVGFVDKDPKNSRKKIFDLPIYYLKKNVSVLLRKYNAEALILVDNELSKTERIQLVDNCIENGYRVFKAPIISELQNNQTEISVKNIQIEDLLARAPIVLDNISIVKQLRQKCILVTGGAGSIGSEIVRQIASYAPRKLIVLDQAETPLHQIYLELKDKFPELDYEVVVADVRNFNRVEQIFKTYDPEVVYHAAAYKHVPLMENNPCEAISTNILGTSLLADLSVKYKVKTFVMVSTDKAVNPSNVMGATKRVAEMYVQSLHYSANDKNSKATNFITTRFGNVLGSNGSVVPLFKKQIESGGPVTITHPDIIRYFMTIPEACSLVLEAGAMGEGGEIFIFDMGAPVKIIDLATKMIKLAGFIPNEDIDIEITGLRPGEKLYEELLSDKATTMPTYNKKIMIAKELTKDYDLVSNAVNEIIMLSEEGNNEKMIKKVKNLIPEFKSMNSTYVSLDQ